jgi:predicted nucleotidyltransferase
VKGESRLIHCPPTERGVMVKVVHQVLAAQSDVAFVNLHGPFAAGGPFHDVDIAVYRDDVRAEEISPRAMELSSRAEAALSRQLEADPPPVDVRALNEAPLGFRYQALRGGRLLRSRNEPLRVEWVARTVGRYLDVKPLRDQALKEAMTA